MIQVIGEQRFEKEHHQMTDAKNSCVIAELNQVDALCENDLRHFTRAQSLKILEDRRDARRKVHV